MIDLVKALIATVPGFAEFILSLLRGDTATLQRVAEILPEQLPTDKVLFHAE